MITLEELHAEVGRATIDTVLLALTDMQGRLQGKRLTARHFLARGRRARRRGLQLPARPWTSRWRRSRATRWPRGSAATATSCCARTSRTLRPVPWQEGTAICLADVAWQDGSDVSASPRQVLRAPARAPRRARLDGQRGHRARVHRLPRHLRGGLAQGLPRARTGQPLQRRLLAARHRARRAADPPDPQQHGGGRDARARTPRASATSASTRSTSATPTR